MDMQITRKPAQPVTLESDSYEDYMQELKDNGPDDNGNLPKRHRPEFEVVEILHSISALNVENSQKILLFPKGVRGIRHNPEEDWHTEDESFTTLLTGEFMGEKFTFEPYDTRVVPYAEQSRLEQLAVARGIETVRNYIILLESMLLGSPITIGPHAPTLRKFVKHSLLHAGYPQPVTVYD